LKNIIRKAEKHSISKTHLKNQEQFHLLGKIRIEHAISEGRRLEAQKHNEQVGINRRIFLFGKTRTRFSWSSREY